MHEAAQNQDRIQHLNQALTTALPNTSARVSSSCFEDCFEIVSDPQQSLELFKVLKENCGFSWFMDMCGADYLQFTNRKRFDVVSHLFAPETNERLRVKIPVNEDDAVPSLTPLWRGANWFEREVWDMFGVRFGNHPNLERILTHHTFQGHPLRKDYDPEHIQELDESLKIHFDPLPEDDTKAANSETDELAAYQWLNIGPSHPATHGTLRIMAEVDGEVVRQSKLEIGYLHRCFEKMAETHTWNQVIPYTDRLNYCSSAMNNIGYCRAVESMLGIEVPERAQVLRMILAEFSRIIDHLVCVAANAIDVGAITTFWYAFSPREKIYDWFESLCGSRLTVSLTRVGGMAQEPPQGWIQTGKELVAFVEKQTATVDRLITKNPIFRARTRGVSAFNREDSIAYGFTGPMIRAIGVDYDLRKVRPYYFYDQVDFDVPIGVNGDVYDRYLVRMEEIRQSCKILRQCLDNLPVGPIKVKKPAISLPDKSDVYNSIEGLMNHFMVVINDVRVPKGDIYSATEAANGELGFYCISDGSGRPSRVHCRAPSFAHYQAFPEMIKGSMIPDVIAALGSLNIIAGELDR